MDYTIKLEVKKDGYHIHFDCEHSLSHLKYKNHPLILEEGNIKVKVPVRTSYEDIGNIVDCLQSLQTTASASSLNDAINKAISHYKKKWKPGLNPEDRIYAGIIGDNLKHDDIIVFYGALLNVIPNISLSKIVNYWERELEQIIKQVKTSHFTSLN